MLYDNKLLFGSFSLEPVGPSTQDLIVTKYLHILISTLCSIQKTPQSRILNQYKIVITKRINKILYSAGR